VILTGSGTAALEAAVVSIVPEQGKILVLDNGRYGERIKNIASAHGIPFTHIKFGWGVPFDLAQVRQALDADPGITTIGIAHHETSTGMLNPMNAIGALAKEYDVEVVVDAHRTRRSTRELDKALR
jgi:2-aminoethylphosphonate-pyruvate transaminase